MENFVKVFLAVGCLSISLIFFAVILDENQNDEKIIETYNLLLSGEEISLREVDFLFEKRLFTSKEKKIIFNSAVVRIPSATTDE